MSRRICFVLSAEQTGAQRTSDVTAEVMARLRERGAVVDIFLPDAARVDIESLRPAHDLYVLKSRTPIALAVAGVLEARGAIVVNSHRSSATARDKLASTALLAAADVPVPPSFATGEPWRIAAIAGSGSVWLKPYRGSRGVGVTRVSAADLEALPRPCDAAGLPLPAFAQADVPSTGRDLKVYVVGEQVWGVSRVYPARTLTEKLGMPTNVAPRLREVALRCGRALGLEIYGVDAVGGDEDFAIVDVNAYPGFKGANGAATAIADHLLARAAGATSALAGTLA